MGTDNDLVTRFEFFRSADEIKAGIAGINDRLDRQNGRLRKVEIHGAIMWVLWLITGSILGTILTIWLRLVIK